jgi:hypothetical protein
VRAAKARVASGVGSKVPEDGAAVLSEAGLGMGKAQSDTGGRYQVSGAKLEAMVLVLAE